MANDKVYDGDDRCDDVVADGDEQGPGRRLWIWAGAATFNNKNVGTGKTVTIVSPTLSGTDASNYNADDESTDRRTSRRRT